MANLDEIKIVVTVQNLDQVKAAIEKADEAVKAAKDALWELSELNAEYHLEK